MSGQSDSDAEAVRKEDCHGAAVRAWKHAKKASQACVLSTESEKVLKQAGVGRGSLTILRAVVLSGVKSLQTSKSA